MQIPLIRDINACMIKMYGMGNAGRERRAEARAALVQCLHGYPCNWAAWLALAEVSGGAEFERVSDPGQACRAQWAETKLQDFCIPLSPRMYANGHFQY